MPTAYVDSSAIVNVSFDEPGADETRRWLNEFDMLVSSSFLEAEVRVAFARERIVFDASILAGIEWLNPGQALTSELTLILSTQYLRTGDLWHVAVALYFFPEPGEITFLTLDNRQRAVAAALGFRV